MRHTTHTRFFILFFFVRYSNNTCTKGIFRDFVRISKFEAVQWMRGDFFFIRCHFFCVSNSTLKSQIGLSLLTSSVGSVVEMRSLKLFGNKLHRLPPELGIFYARFSVPRIFSQTFSIGKMGSLKQLVLFGNSLAFVPKSLERLSNVRTFYLPLITLVSLMLFLVDPLSPKLE